MTSETQETLDHSLHSFASDCNAHEKLRVMNRDWNRTIHIHATDLNCHFTLTTQQSSVTVSAGAPDHADLVVMGDAELLTQIFYGELSPNEPYNEGTLRLKGSEEDILRLDFVTAMLWGE